MSQPTPRADLRQQGPPGVLRPGIVHDPAVEGILDVEYLAGKTGRFRSLEHIG